MKEQEIIFITNKFLVFDKFLSFSKVGAGNINGTWRIDIEKQGVTQSFLLQKLNTSVFPKPWSVAKNIAFVAKYLEQSPAYPLKVAVPITTLGGQQMFASDESSCWRLFPFFFDTFAPEQLPTTEQAYEASHAYGTFLSALGGIQVEQIEETIPNFHNTDYRWTYFEKILKEDKYQRAQSAKVEINALYDAKSIFNKISLLKSSGQLGLRVTHNDTKAGNVLLDIKTNKAVAVIDWDTIMPGTVLSDFGDMVRTFVPDRYEDAPTDDGINIRASIMDALFEGFLSSTTSFLSPVERSNLLVGAEWIVGEQALRFLTDYLTGDIYYSVNYPMHNFVRAKNQLALLAQLQSR